MQLEYTAPDFVYDAIADLGRTEDVKFSPSSRRLAVACFAKNQVAIFDISMPLASEGSKLTLTDVAFISSSYLRQPHGVDFIDEDRLIVANREGNVTTFELPRKGGGQSYELEPIGLIRSGELMSPGAISVQRKGKEKYQALVCNNLSNRITSHLIDSNGNSKKDGVLLAKWLRFPDGIDVSDRWIAISNNQSPHVLLYDRRRSLDEDSDPDGFLRYCNIPHGVRFALDSRFIVVADYDGPFVLIYKEEDLGWGGVRNPIASLRVMSDEVFFRGDPRRGRGPKGLDISRSSNTLVVTCHMLPLAFFDLAAICQEVRCPQGKGDVQAQIDFELNRADELKLLKQSLSWRITAPLRWVRGH